MSEEVTLDELRARAAVARAGDTRSMQEQMRDFTDLVNRTTGELRAAEIDAGIAAAWLAALPTKAQRAMIVGRVRCPGNRVLLRAVRLPTDAPTTRRWSTAFLAVPTSGARHRHDDGTVAAAEPWWLVPGSAQTWDLRCRCHAAWRRVDVEGLLFGAQ